MKNLLSNPHAEDFERLAVRFIDHPSTAQRYSSIVEALEAFPELYAQDRDGLPQNDSDRAFWLTARSCRILDDNILFAVHHQQVADLTSQADALLEEALKLDSQCFDALRIQFSLHNDLPAAEEEFLASKADEVRESCLAQAQATGVMAPDKRWSASVLLRPYLRWMMNLASVNLELGRYRRCLEICHEVMDKDTNDITGTRLIAALALVKLEDASGLNQLVARFGHERNAWFDLGQMIMAYKQLRMKDAAFLLHELVRNYPGAGPTLVDQREIQQGYFCHLPFTWGSEDELFLAVSEFSVVLNDGDDEDTLRTPLASFIALDPQVQQAYEEQLAARQLFPDGTASASGTAVQAAGGTPAADGTAGPNGSAGSGPEDGSGAAGEGTQGLPGAATSGDQTAATASSAATGAGGSATADGDSQGRDSQGRDSQGRIAHHYVEWLVVDAAGFDADGKSLAQNTQAPAADAQAATDTGSQGPAATDATGTADAGPTSTEDPAIATAYLLDGSHAYGFSGQDAASLLAELERDLEALSAQPGFSAGSHGGVSAGDDPGSDDSPGAGEGGEAS